MVVAASGSGQLDALPQRDGSSDVDPSLPHDEATSDAPENAAADALQQRDRNSEVEASLPRNEPAVSDAPILTADTDAGIPINTPPLPNEPASDAGVLLPLATSPSPSVKAISVAKAESQDDTLRPSSQKEEPLFCNVPVSCWSYRIDTYSFLAQKYCCCVSCIFSLHFPNRRLF
jgi:hypothetical protein